VIEPVARPHATLVELLDRVLDRGVVINADIIISLAGVPLIGVNLRAALAGMETMVKYGVMKEWDQKIRTQSLQESNKSAEGSLSAKEEVPIATGRDVSRAKDQG